MLVASPTRPYPPEDRDAFRQWVEQYPRNVQRADFDRQTSGLPADFRDALFRDYVCIPKARLRGGRLIENQDLSPLMRSISVPALYCYGDRDSIVDHECAMQTFLTLPPEKRSLFVEHGAEHMLPCLVPHVLAGTVSRFLVEHAEE